MFRENPMYPAKDDPKVLTPPDEITMEEILRDKSYSRQEPASITMLTTRPPLEGVEHSEPRPPPTGSPRLAAKGLP